MVVAGVTGDTRVVAVVITVVAGDVVAVVTVVTGDVAVVVTVVVAVVVATGRGKVVLSVFCR